MKKILIACLLILPTIVFAQPLAGTYKIGTTGNCGGACDYTSIGAAFIAIGSNGINANVVFEIYTDIAEPAPAALGDFLDFGGPHTITFRPFNNTLKIISGNTAAPFIQLAGADRVIFDGRPSSDETLSLANRWLMIRNTGVGSTIAVSSDAVSCSFRSVIVEGRNTSPSGVFNVSGGSVAGNDDLAINFCDIKNDGSGGNLPLVGISLEGGTLQNNDNVQITNNRIFNFFTETGGGTGISVGNYNNSLLISGNSIYQEANRTATSNVIYRGIHINSPAGANFQILNNFIGGTAEGAGGTQGIIHAPSGGYVRARLIDIEDIGFGGATVVSDNTIRGFQTTNLSSTSAANASLYGIYIMRGNVEVRNNTIGGTTTDQRLTASFTNATGRLAGIGFDTNSTGTGIIGLIENNSIDGLFVTSTGSVTGDRLESIGIYIEQEVGNDQIVIRKNIIGNLTGNEYFTTSTTSVNSGTYVAGIYSTTSRALTIDRNKIANIWNRVDNATDPQFFGIHLNTPTTAQLTGNQIYSLTSLSTSSDYNGVGGVFLDALGTGTVKVDKNTIWGIAAGSGAVISGLLLQTGSSTSFIPQIENNMITLGSTTTENTQFRGICLMGDGSGNTALGSVQIYANSVVVRGSGTGASNTHAFYRSGTHDGPVELFANIFVNSRSGGGNHYALFGQDSHTNITSNYNLLFASTAGNLTEFNSTARSFAAWQAASSQDVDSRNFDISPKFMNVASGNLRIPDDGSADVTDNIVDKGAANASANPISSDIDNANRTGITDIGASEVMVTWLGTTNADWHTASNWSNGVTPSVPSCGARELVKIGPNIPGIVLNQPLISAGTANFRELIILEGATVTLSGSGQLEQCPTGIAPYSLTNGGTLVVNGRPITLYGNFVQNGIFNAGTGTVSLIASSAQSINGDLSPVTFNNLSIDGGGVKTTNQVVRVNGVLALTNGLVTTSSAYPLILSTAGTYTGGSNASYVNGLMGKQTTSVTPFTFPVGKGGKIRPVIIEPSNSLASTFFAEYFNQSALDNIGSAMSGTITRVSDLEYWRINRTGLANGFITLTWDFASGVSADQADRDLLGVVRWNGSQWINHFQSSNTGTSTSGQVVSTFVGVFDTYFTLGSSTTNNPLPILLDYFKVRLDKAEGIVLAEWATEMEEVFDRFELEKASDDLVFTKIAEIKSKASGEPRMLREYSYIDNFPYIGRNYYRLKAVDLDGSYQYFNVENVFYEGDSKISVYPNPVKSSEVLTVKVQFMPTPQDRVSLMNMQGVEVMKTNIEHIGENEVMLHSNVQPGLYLLRYNSNGFQKVVKVVVK